MTTSIRHGGLCTAPAAINEIRLPGGMCLPFPSIPAALWSLSLKIVPTRASKQHPSTVIPRSFFPHSFTLPSAHSLSLSLSFFLSLSPCLLPVGGCRFSRFRCFSPLREISWQESYCFSSLGETNNENRAERDRKCLKNSLRLHSWH